jgi:hypothetical protein
VALPFWMTLPPLTVTSSATLLVTSGQQPMLLLLTSCKFDNLHPVGYPGATKYRSILLILVANNASPTMTESRPISDNDIQAWRGNKTPINDLLYIKKRWKLLS